MIHRRSRGLAPGCSNGPHWSPLCVRRTHLERGCGSSGIFDCARAPRLVLILLLPYGVCVSRPGLHRDSIIFSSIVWGEGGFAVRNESGPGLHLDSLTSAPDRGGLRCTRGHFLKSIPFSLILTNFRPKFSTKFSRPRNFHARSRRNPCRPTTRSLATTLRGPQALCRASARCGT